MGNCLRIETERSEDVSGRECIKLREREFIKVDEFRLRKKGGFQWNANQRRPKELTHNIKYKIIYQNK